MRYVFVALGLVLAHGPGPSFAVAGPADASAMAKDVRVLEMCLEKASRIRGHFVYVGTLSYVDPAVRSVSVRAAPVNELLHARLKQKWPDYGSSAADTLIVVSPVEWQSDGAARVRIGLGQLEGPALCEVRRGFGGRRRARVFPVE